MRHTVFRLILALFPLALIAGCMTDSEKRRSGSTGQAAVTIRLERVASLAKGAVIEMKELHVRFSAAGEDTVKDVLAVSGNDAQAVTKTYPGLKRGKSWTMTVIGEDARDSVIYSGSKAFSMPDSGTGSVELNLAARYSMLTARFFPIYDSVTRVELHVDGMKVDDSSFAKQSLLGDTVKVGWDYLSASTAGTQHAIRLSVYGLKAGGDTTLLYRGDTTLTVVAGKDESYNVKLYWVNPGVSPTGPAAITVGLGTVGEVTVSGKLEEGWEMYKWGRVTREGFENVTGYPGYWTDRANGLALSSTGQPYVAVNTTNGGSGILRLVGSKWQTVGQATLPSISLSLLLVSQGDVPYVVYSKNNQIHAAKFNGTQWDTLGGPLFPHNGLFWSAALSNSGALHVINTNARLFRWSGTKWDTIALTGPNPNAFAISKTGVPHIVSGSPGGNPNRLYRLNGTTWDTVGTGNFGMSSPRSLAFSATNQAYMAQEVSGGGIRVVRWTGSTYSQVGGVISDSSLSSVSLSIHGDTPYLAFRRQGSAPAGSSNYLQASVVKFNGSNWEYLGGLGFTSAFLPSGGISTLTLAIAPDATPYLSCGGGSQPVVLRYNLP